MDKITLPDRKKFYYIASPYSHESDKVRQDRYESAAKFSVRCSKSGYIVYSPIAHHHPLAVNYDLPTDFSYWKELDTRFIKACDVLLVLVISGWDDSKGVASEIEIAKDLGKEILYIDG